MHARSKQARLASARLRLKQHSIRAVVASVWWGARARQRQASPCFVVKKRKQSLGDFAPAELSDIHAARIKPRESVYVGYPRQRAPPNYPHHLPAAHSRFSHIVATRWRRGVLQRCQEDVARVGGSGHELGDVAHTQQ